MEASPRPPQSYQGLSNGNFFTADPLTVRLVSECLPPSGKDAALARLKRFGAFCAGPLAELIEAAHAEGKLPKLLRYDRWGERVDRVEYCAEQRTARRLVLESGVLPPTPLVERMTMAYLLNQNGEGGVACPLAMTDGLIELLEKRGSPEQRRRYLPLLRDPAGETPLTGGQFVTEKHGGSTVSENDTRARRCSDGSWRLSGLKWFCSNPGELWVTTAKPENSSRVALFLVPRRLPGGELNECHLLRLKDLSGTRGKATAEVEYREAYAELIGRPGEGLALLLSTVLRTSRIHVAAGSLGIARRAFAEAELYCRSRIVQGRPAADLAPVARELRAMGEDLERATRAFFTMLRCLEADDEAAAVLVPLLKIELSRLGSDLVRRARLLLAGNGSLRDFSPLPRLAEDALISEIWEGTHPILAAHAAKALRRPRSRAAFLALLEEGAPAPHAAEADDEALCRSAYASLTRRPSGARAGVRA